MGIKDCRKKIDILDDKLMNLFVERFKIIELIKEIKKKKNVNNPKREKEIIFRLVKKYPNLEKDFIHELCQVIFKYSKKRQNE